jgi:geranylgeranyl pyrophosphate synthase
MGEARGASETIAREWLARAGKRWRPFLTVAAFQATRQEPGEAIPDKVKKIAVAIECFHKASLIHDDIEDNDEFRYGEKTLHEEHGVAVALNVGDLLIGEGYRLIAASGADPEQIIAMLTAAAECQRQLCHGQGAELEWTRQPGPLTTLQVLDIFRRKTAPAFEVALRLGALCSGVDEHDEVADTLRAYSEALGIAYQIRDDLTDLGDQGETNDIAGLRPSLLLAVAHERASEPSHKETTSALWRRQPPAGLNTAGIESLYNELKADERCQSLLETYKEEAIRSLRDLDNPNLKGLLRRVVGKIFNDVEIKGWCNEQEQRNARLRESAAELQIQS